MHLENGSSDLIRCISLKQRVVHLQDDTSIYRIQDILHTYGICCGKQLLKVLLCYVGYVVIRCAPYTFLVLNTRNMILSSMLTSPLMKEFCILITSRQPNRSRSLSPKKFILVEDGVDFYLQSIDCLQMFSLVLHGELVQYDLLFLEP